jgi:hypothetical protein
MAVGWQALVVAVIAAFVGLAELVARYRSDPGYALTRPLAWLYIAVNAFAGVIALLLIRAFDWKFGQTENIDLFRILVAGFAAIAFFRTSFFTATIGGTTIGVGPSLVLGSLLDACDRDVDRKSAAKMAEIATDENLGDLDPGSVMSALPVLCLALMQNFPASDQAQLAADISRIRNDTTLAGQAQMRAVVIQLAKQLGAPLVNAVLRNGRGLFTRPAPVPVPTQPPVPVPTEALIAEARKLGEAESPPETTGGST